jgi:hypothetical protein
MLPVVLRRVHALHRRSVPHILYTVHRSMCSNAGVDEKRVKGGAVDQVSSSRTFADVLSGLDAQFASMKPPSKDQIAELFSVLSSEARAPKLRVKPDGSWATRNVDDVCRQLRPVLRDFAAFGVDLEPRMAQTLVALHCRAGLLPSAAWIVRQLPWWLLRPDITVLSYLFKVCSTVDADTEVLNTTGVWCVTLEQF